MANKHDAFEMEENYLRALNHIKTSDPVAFGRIKKYGISCYSANGKFNKCNYNYIISVSQTIAKREHSENV